MSLDAYAVAFAVWVSLGVLMQIYYLFVILDGEHSRVTAPRLFGRQQLRAAARREAGSMLGATMATSRQNRRMAAREIARSL